MSAQSILISQLGAIQTSLVNGTDLYKLFLYKYKEIVMFYDGFN